jgi:hypothetical protein
VWGLAVATIYCADHTYATAPQYPHPNRPCCLRVHTASRGRALFNSLFSLLPRTTRPFVSRVRQSARLGSGLRANQMQPHVKAWGTEAEPPKFLVGESLFISGRDGDRSPSLALQTAVGLRIDGTKIALVPGTGVRPAMSIASSRARSRPTFRCRRQPSMSWRSI